jgi:indolepyruvate ferredoxin oxidoreductase beta subunit
MAEAAAGAGTVISAVMLGAIAGSGLLPFPQQAFEATIRAAGKGVEASLAGFARGHAAMSGDADASTSTRPPAHRRWSALPGEVAERFPPATHDILAAGYARMREFQDEAYARSYVERLARVLAVEREADPEARNGFAATRETARFLGAWMAFDDIVRVADLKSRASRFDRVRDEVRAAPEDVVRIYDHFKPGIAELSSLLPARLADRLQRWDRRRIAKGKEAFAVPLKLPAHSVLGLLALRSLASLKGLRRLGYRYAAEQEAMERWLAAVEAGLRCDWALGHEIALCGRLVKGYGATNERGKEHLLHVIAHFASSGDFADDDARRRAIRALRESALADDTGRSLDRALVQHGAPPRPVKAQPVTWVKSRPGGRAPRKVA